MSLALVEQLIADYEGNTLLIHRIADDVTQNESLMQPPFAGGNCLNWVLGHMLSSRHEALAALRAEPVWPLEIFERYRRGSPPIVGGQGARSLADLLIDADTTTAALAAALAGIVPEAMAETIDTPFGPHSRAARVAGLHWHETFHLGQLDLLKTMIVAERVTS